MDGKQGTACQSRAMGTWAATAMVAEWRNFTPGSRGDWTSVPRHHWPASG
jgi:hypothetical protein